MALSREDKRFWKWFCSFMGIAFIAGFISYPVFGSISEGLGLNRIKSIPSDIADEFRSDDTDVMVIVAQPFEEEIFTQTEEEVRRYCGRTTDNGKDYDNCIKNGLSEPTLDVVPEEEPTPDIVPEEDIKIEVNEGDLIKLELDDLDPGGNSLSYEYSRPLDENGEWQTLLGDAGVYKTEVRVSQGGFGHIKTILITVNDATSQIDKEKEECDADPDCIYAEFNIQEENEPVDRMMGGSFDGFN